MPPPPPLSSSLPPSIALPSTDSTPVWRALARRRLFLRRLLPLRRRLLALVIASKAGATKEAWRMATLLEDLPGDDIGSLLPATIHSTLRTQMKEHLQIEAMLRGNLPKKEGS